MAGQPTVDLSSAHSESMLRSIRYLALILASTATFASVASAQGGAPRSNTTGLLLGAALSGAAIDSDDFESEPSSGGGIELQLGWGFSPLFTLLMAGNGAVLDSEDGDDEFVLVHFDLLARFNFRSPGNAFVPYVEGGISARVAGQDDVLLEDEDEPVNLEISGAGFTLGGGFHYFVTPALALGANLRITSGEFDTIKIDNITVDDAFEIDATSTRLNLGLTWYPIRRR
jgi:hypothetical protein